jgi:ankyrin repeat protein
MDAVVGRLPPDQRLITAVAALDQAAFDAAVADDASATGRDGNGMTALAYAAVVGNQPLIERLLAQGADIDAANNYGFTPLMQAANFDHAEVVELLLRNGANPNCRNRFGETAADRAREQGSIAAIAALNKWVVRRSSATPPQSPARTWSW